MKIVTILLNLGLEEFEEKINKLGEEEEAKLEEGSWIGDLLKEFAKVKTDVEKELINEDDETEDDIHDIEPPLFDPKWSLDTGKGL